MGRSGFIFPFVFVGATASPSRLENVRLERTRMPRENFAVMLFVRHLNIERWEKDDPAILS